MKKNIFHILESSATGTLAVVSMIANMQKKHGHNVNIIYSKREETPEDFEKYFHDGIKIKEIRMSGFINIFNAYFSLRKHLSKYESHIFLHSSFAGFIGRIALLGIKQIKLFYVPHSISLMKRDINNLIWLIYYLLELVPCLKKFEYIACSKSEYEVITKYLPFRKCNLVENAVSLNYPINKSNHNGFKVVNAALMRDQKDPILFGRIAKKTRAFDNSIRFIWIGDGENKYKNFLIESGVEVTGMLKRDSVIDYISQSDIFLSTSKYEGMPICLIEAMLCKITVIATNTRGNSDTVTHKHTGFLFNGVDEATNLIKTLKEDEARRISIENNAFKEASIRYSPERYHADIDNLM